MHFMTFIIGKTFKDSKKFEPFRIRLECTKVVEISRERKRVDERRRETPRGHESRRKTPRALEIRRELPGTHESLAKCSYLAQACYFHFEVFD